MGEFIKLFQHKELKFILVLLSILQEIELSYLQWLRGNSHFISIYDSYDKYGVSNRKIILIKAYDVYDKNFNSKTKV